MASGEDSDDCPDGMIERNDSFFIGSLVDAGTMLLYGDYLREHGDDHAGHVISLARANATLSDVISATRTVQVTLQALQVISSLFKTPLSLRTGEQ